MQYMKRAFALMIVSLSNPFVTLHLQLHQGCIAADTRHEQRQAGAKAAFARPSCKNVESRRGGGFRIETKGAGKLAERGAQGILVVMVRSMMMPCKCSCCVTT